MTGCYCCVAIRLHIVVVAVVLLRRRLQLLLLPLLLLLEYELRKVRYEELRRFQRFPEYTLRLTLDPEP